MGNEDTPVDSGSDNLDDFSATFFGQKEDTKEATTSEEASKDEDLEVDATETDAEADALETEDEDTSDEDEDEKDESPPPEPKKKNRFQERIDELTAKAREAERREADVKSQLDSILAKLEQNDPPKPVKAAEERIGPTPEDQNENGEDKYPLGEFDPQYIRDLTRFTFDEEAARREQKITQDQAQQAIERQKVELQSTWQEKVGPAQERYPDFQQKVPELLGTFEEIDPSYGEYLSATIMSMEFGPDVLYYLSNHPDEAKKIVGSGAVSATISLGRLESKFALAEEEKQKARPKVSNAPEPPPHVNKGSSAAKVEVDDDTDDLDAFADKFFSKKKRRS